MIEVARIDSPIGTLHASVRGDTLVALDFGRLRTPLLRARFGDEPVREARDPGGVARALDRYFRGDLAALDAIPYDTGGTAFRRAVWRAMTRIPAGGTWSYGRLARAAGSPNAVRAAGTACGANPVPIVVPCHRVVRAGGAIGNYGGGVARKRWLLDHERANA
jgi:methylated-DNA-[protein]-cysteine S-methyltransferase